MYRKERIDALRTLPAELRKAVAGLSDTQLDSPYRDDGWTLRQVVHHLADSHMNAYVRARLILTEDHPMLKPYDQDAWARLVDAGRGPLAPSFAILDGVHTRFVQLLENCAGADWERSGHHPESGEMSLDEVLSIYSAHGRKHVGQILGLRSRKGW
jgi:DinB superfamily